MIFAAVFSLVPSSLLISFCPSGCEAGVSRHLMASAGHLLGRSCCSVLLRECEANWSSLNNLVISA